MIETSTGELVLLALVGGGDRDGDRGGLDVVELGECLEMNTSTLADRIALLSSLSKLEDEGLVAEVTADDRRRYELTDRGRDRAVDLSASVADTPITVANGGTERVTLADADQYLSDPALPRALARLTDDGVLHLGDGVDCEFVDREAERDALDAHLAATREGNGRAVLVTGAGGVGKTALVEEFLSTAEGVRTLSGVCRGDASDPYGAVRAALDPHLDDSPFDRHAPAPDDPDDLADLRAALFSDVTDAVLALADDRPVVVFLDDLQDAAGPTVELLSYLAGRLTGRRAMVVATASLEGLAEDHPVRELAAEWADADDHDRLTVGPFDRAATRELVESELDTRRVPGEFVDLVYEHTGGNALFVAETLSELVETDVVVPEHDVYPGGPGLLPASDRVEATIERRVRGLDDDARSVLHTAALLGERFSVGDLVAACDLPAPRVREYVDVLADARVATPVDGDDDRVRFTSGLFHETVLDRIPDDRRPEYHRRIADRLADRVGSDPEHAAKVAHHYERAGDPRALDAWVEAAEYAESVYAHELAREHYERGLELARERDDGRALDVLESLGDVERLLGDQEAARRAFEVVRNRADDHQRRRRAVRKTAAVYNTLAKYDLAAEAAEEGLALGGDDPTPEDCELLAVLYEAYTARGAYDRGREVVERQREVAAELGDRNREARALRQLGAIAQMERENGRAIARLQEALALFRDQGDREGIGRCLRNLGLVARQRGEFDRAREFFREGLEIARERNDRSSEAAHLGNLGLVTRRQDEYDRARECFQRTLEIARDLDDRQFVSNSLNNLGLVAKDRGEFDRAEEYFQRSLEHDREAGVRESEANSLGNLGHLAFHRGEYDRAEELLERSLAIERDLDDPFGEGRSINDLGKVDLRRGRYDRARERFEASLSIAREIDDSQMRAAALDTLGELAGRRGVYDRAREHLEQALDVSRDYGGETGASRLRLGRVALDAGDYPAASDHLGAAMETFEDAGDHLGSAECRLLRGQLALARGDVETARERGRRAREAFAALDATHWTGRSRLLLGRVAADAGDPDSARQHWRAALEAFESVGAPQDALAALERLVETCRDHGDDDRARDYCERAERLLSDAPDAVGDRHREWVRERSAALRAE